VQALDDEAGCLDADPTCSDAVDAKDCERSCQQEHSGCLEDETCDPSCDMTLSECLADCTAP
jgi:hypothetical protein